jgi:hypothetical protein
LDDTLIVWKDVMSQLSSGTESSEISSEKRRWPRYGIDVRVRATVPANHASRTVYGRGTALGRCGMAAVLPIELAVGDTINVGLTLPYCTQSFTLAAVVRNRSSFTYGLEFVGISASQQAEIDRVCRLLVILQ